MLWFNILGTFGITLWIGFWETVFFNINYKAIRLLKIKIKMKDRRIKDDKDDLIVSC